MRRHLTVYAVTGLLLLTLTACGAGAAQGGKTGAGGQSEHVEAAMDETNKTADAETLNQGTPAPDFEMTDLKGNKVRLSDLKGQKVYLKYWASWCPICLGGLEDINTLSAEDQGFRVLTIVAPGQKGEKNMEDFKEWFSGVDNTKNIEVLFDTDGAYGAKTGVRGYPTSEYIGSDGITVKLAPGHADNNTIISTFKTIQ